MMRYRHIVILAACISLILSCSNDKEKVIPRDRLAKIYAEMFMTDQWIQDTPGVRRMADTSLVYQPILEKYGYTAADYRVTVEKYLDDPERFSRILRTSVEILDKRLADLKRRKEEQDHIRALEKLLHQLKYESDFEPEDFFPYLFDEPYVHYYDSLSIEPDSTLMIYRLMNIERSDTIYDGLKMTVKDTVERNDTVVVGDSLSLDHNVEE